MDGEVAAGWIKAEVRRNVYPSLLRRYGFDQFEQEALFALCNAAFVFDPVAHPGTAFVAYAQVAVRHRLWRVAHLHSRVHRVSLQAPVDRDGEQFLDPADHRAESPVHPALRAWCSEEYARQRRCLDWRARVILYLRTVEGWELFRIGDALAISKARVEQLVNKAVARLAAYRERLEGGSE